MEDKSKLIVENGLTYFFADLMDNSYCPECKKKLEFSSVTYDAGGADYFATCCGKTMLMFPHMMVVEVS